MREVLAVPPSQLGVIVQRVFSMSDKEIHPSIFLSLKYQKTRHRILRRIEIYRLLGLSFQAEKIYEKWLDPEINLKEKHIFSSFASKQGCGMCQTLEG